MQPSGQPGSSHAHGLEIENLRSALLSSQPGEAAHEAALQQMRDIADRPDGVLAQWLLGAYFLSAEARPGGISEAWVWVERAATAGVAPAMDRLADLHLRGLLRPRSIASALSLQLQLADRGFYRSAWEAGYLLDWQSEESGEPASRAEPASLYARACALAYPQAYFSLGMRFVQGNGVRQDRDFGRALLIRAADGRFLGAQDAADRFAPAHECPGAVEWHRRLKQNLDAAQPGLERLRPSDGPTQETLNPLIPRLEAHFASIGHTSIGMDANGRLRVALNEENSSTVQDKQWQWLSEQPRVACAHRFATIEECAHLINKVAAQLTQARGYAGAGSANDTAELSFFNGEGTPIRALYCDSVIRRLEHRLMRMTDWSPDALEPCSIIRYLPGQAYQPHVDFFSDEQIEINRNLRRDHGGQRIATFLLYLRAPDMGGETEYLHAGLRVKGEAGMAVLHYNVTPDGRADTQSLHSGRAIEQGEKWLWRSTLRAMPLVGALG